MVFYNSFLWFILKYEMVMLLLFMVYYLFNNKFVLLFVFVICFKMNLKSICVILYRGFSDNVENVVELS